MDRQARIDQLKLIHIKMGKPRAQRRPAIGGKWTQEEDDRLRAIIQEHGPKNWKKVLYSRNILKFFFRLLKFLVTQGLKFNVYIDGIKS